MKLKNKIFIISLMLLVLLGISYASASEEDVTLTNDTMEVLTSNDDVEVQMQDSNDEQLSNSDEDKLSRTGSFADLLTEIGNSYGSTLVLDDSYENNGNEAAITLEEDIIIDGNGHTIDAKGKSNIFLIDEEFLNPSKGVVFKNIVFKNAYGETFGGAIRIDQNINCKIENCTFIQNKAEMVEQQYILTQLKI